MSRQLDLGQMTAYDLIDWLDKQHPRPLPKPGMSLELLNFEGGKRDLIEALLTRKEREQDGKRNLKESL